LNPLSSRLENSKPTARQRGEIAGSPGVDQPLTTLPQLTGPAAGHPADTSADGRHARLPSFVSVQAMQKAFGNQATLLYLQRVSGTGSAESRMPPLHRVDGPGLLTDDTATPPPIEAKPGLRAVRVAPGQYAVQRQPAPAPSAGQDIHARIKEVIGSPDPMEVIRIMDVPDFGRANDDERIGLIRIVHQFGGGDPNRLARLWRSFGDPRLPDNESYVNKRLQQMGFAQGDGKPLTPAEHHRRVPGASSVL
jgi:hypothetical protein